MIPSAIPGTLLEMECVFTIRDGLPFTYPPDDAIAAARDRYREIASRSRRGDLFDPTTDHRWSGFLFEAVVSSWLRSESIPHVWNGGLDNLPDFEIAGIGVGAKSRAWSLTSADRPSFLWPVAQALPPAVIFGTFNPDDLGVTIYGVISGRAVSRSELLRAGVDEIAPGHLAKVDNYRVAAERLRSPLAWLQDLYVSRLQHAAA